MLRAGSAKTVITPALGTPLGGNARTDNYAQGVLHELFARALYVDNGFTQVCLLSLDLLGMWQPDADPLRQAVADELGIPFGNVMLACTHTHSGPDTFQSLCWNDDKISRDTELLKPFWHSLPGKVVEAARAAKASATAATMQYGTAENHDVANNRRLKMKTGETRMNWELPPADGVEGALGPVDPQVSVVTFRRTRGELLGGFLHFACHPAILAGLNMEISGDWPGFAMSQLEAEFGCPAMLYLQGASGNVNHIDYHHPERGRDAREVHRCADSVVASAREAIKNGNHRDTESQRDTAISVLTSELLLPIRQLPADKIEWAKQVLARYDGRDLSLPDGIPPELNARRTLKLLEAQETGRYNGKFASMRDGKVVLPLQVVRLGDVILATVPSEIFVEFGIRFREEMKRWAHLQHKSEPLALIVGLANGVANYIPTPEAFAQGGYEPGLGPSYLPEDAGNEIIDTLLHMAGSVAA